MRNYREGDIVKLSRSYVPWEGPDNTEYLLIKNNGPKEQLFVAGVQWKQPDIWQLEALTGNRKGSFEYDTIYHMILLRPVSALNTYSGTLPPI